MQQFARDTNNPVSINRSSYFLSACYHDLGRAGEAREVMPPRTVVAEISLTDRVFFDCLLMRRALTSGDATAAAAAAAVIFDEEEIADSASRASLAQWSTWAFIADGSLDLAARAARMGLGEGDDVPMPGSAALEAELSFLDGDFEGAVRRARSAVEFLEQAQCRWKASPMRRRLADMLLARGDVGAAQAELQKVVEVAGRLGMVVERRLAAQELHKLGIEVVEDGAASAPAASPTGERYVSVLFMDVRGYTALTRDSSPAEVADGIAALQRWAAGEVAKHQGIVDKFAGDAVMATFNVSGAHVDHAQHALACALAIRDKAAALELPMGAGIATGPAVVGALKQGANVSVLGETTNLASRLQAQAGPGEILLSAETHRRAVDWLTSRGYVAESGRLDLKGFAEPVDAWRLREGRGDG